MSLFDEFDAFKLPCSNDSSNLIPKLGNPAVQYVADGPFKRPTTRENYRTVVDNSSCHSKQFNKNTSQNVLGTRTFDSVPSAPTDDLFLSQIFLEAGSKTNGDIGTTPSQTSQFHDRKNNVAESKVKSVHSLNSLPIYPISSNHVDHRHADNDYFDRHNKFERYASKFYNETPSDRFKIDPKLDICQSNKFNVYPKDGNNFSHAVTKSNDYNKPQTFTNFNEEEKSTTDEDNDSPNHDVSKIGQQIARITSQMKPFGMMSVQQWPQMNNLRPVTEIPKKFRHLFNFTHFNSLQSEIFDHALYKDDPLVVSAPTGSGKTVIFELAIVRLILLKESKQISNFKIVYMAPIKALVSEKFNDWKVKLSQLDLKCCELTGDTEMDDYAELKGVQVILTTPEKWDFMTRRWRDNKSLVQLVKLFLIDEVHTINDDIRGATLEAVVNRMKTLHLFDRTSANYVTNLNERNQQLRFIAVSATIPNIEDLAAWLGSKGKPALYLKIDDDQRPVPLKKIVLGFNKSNSISAFKFDLLLNYRIPNILETYSDLKPTLIFCSTRKGTVQTATTLVKETKFLFQSDQRQKLKKISAEFKDQKLGELISSGIAYHHAGLDLSDRKLVEELFSLGFIAVLISTSTLAMGVNLPAHLVIIKSTQHYVMGTFQEYTESQVLQMIGRAGRPQFDTSATAVIMTQNSTKEKYESLLNGTQLVESTLHLHLIEHLNAEIVLQTITDVVVALEWIKSSFLYIRMNKNPKHYDVDLGENADQVEKKLHELCLTNLNKLASLNLISMDGDCFGLTSTDNGRLMARYCVAFDTMKNFFKLTGSEGMEELFDLFCNSEEFKDITLRVNERKVLNDLNKHKNKLTIRFSMKDKIKTNVMKVNCLLQSLLGCLPLHDFALQQDTNKILRSAVRISRCLVEVVWNMPHFKSLHNSILLSKCLRTKLWENSKYVSKQISGIGLVMATSLVNSGVTSFESILNTNPRNLELMVNRQPPFGNTLQDTVRSLPAYEFNIFQHVPSTNDSAELTAHVKLINAEQLKNKSSTGDSHTCVILIGGPDNAVFCKAKIRDSQLMDMTGNTWSHKFTVKQSCDGEEEIEGHLISQDWVGFDISVTFKPVFGCISMKRKKPQGATNVTSTPVGTNSNKGKKSVKKQQNQYEKAMEDLKRKSEKIPISPAFKRLKTTPISDFAYNKIVDLMPPITPIRTPMTSTNFYQNGTSSMPNKPINQCPYLMGSFSTKPKSRNMSYIIESPHIKISESDQYSQANLSKLNALMGISNEEACNKSSARYENKSAEVSIFKAPIGFPYSVNKGKKFNYNVSKNAESRTPGPTENSRSHGELLRNHTNQKCRFNPTNTSTKYSDGMAKASSVIPDDNDNNKFCNANNFDNSCDQINDDDDDADGFYSSSPSDLEYSMANFPDGSSEHEEKVASKSPIIKSDSVPDLYKIGQLTGNFDLINESSFFGDQYSEKFNPEKVKNQSGLNPRAQNFSSKKYNEGKPSGKSGDLFAGVFD